MGANLSEEITQLSLSLSVSGEFRRGIEIGNAFVKSRLIEMDGISGIQTQPAMCSPESENGEGYTSFAEHARRYDGGAVLNEVEHLSRTMDYAEHSWSNQR